MCVMYCQVVFRLPCSPEATLSGRAAACGGCDQRGWGQPCRIYGLTWIRRWFTKSSISPWGHRHVWWIFQGFLFLCTRPASSFLLPPFSPPLLINIHHTTQHTPLISHHLTALISQRLSQTNHFTPLISHRSSHTTRLTTTYLTPNSYKVERQKTSHLGLSGPFIITFFDRGRIDVPWRWQSRPPRWPTS